MPRRRSSYSGPTPRANHRDRPTLRGGGLDVASRSTRSHRTVRSPLPANDGLLEGTHLNAAPARRPLWQGEGAARELILLTPAPQYTSPAKDHREAPSRRRLHRHRTALSTESFIRATSTPSASEAPYEHRPTVLDELPQRARPCRRTTKVRPRQPIPGRLFEKRDFAAALRPPASP